MRIKQTERNGKNNFVEIFFIYPTKLNERLTPSGLIFGSEEIRKIFTNYYNQKSTNNNNKLVSKFQTKSWKNLHNFILVLSDEMTQNLS